MFRGFWVLLDNASLRHLAIGAAVALIMVSAFAVFQRISADPGRHPDAWLTPAEERELLAAMHSVGSDEHWVAGCLWDGDDRRILDEVDPPDGARQLYRGATATGRALALVAVESVSNPGDISAVERRGLYCLVPGP